jgi:hypothetical protein
MKNKSEPLFPRSTEPKIRRLLSEEVRTLKDLVFGFKAKEALLISAPVFVRMRIFIELNGAEVFGYNNATADPRDVELVGTF